ncbi:MAG: signal peptide peptidase SppA [Candidatus Babeliales bacterium]
MARLFDYLKNIFLILILLQIAPPILQSLKKQYLEVLEPKTQIGLLTIKGIVYDSDYYIKFLKQFFKNTNIKAILLKIESPGGAAGSSEAIANEIEIMKRESPKPIVTLCENLCTSGSYYIASTTDYIIAPPSALIGSIGTKIPYQFKLNDFLKHFNIKYIPIKSGEYKDSTDPFAEITSEQIAQLQSVTDDSYQNFIEHVAKNRSQVMLDNAKEWANGKLFTARQALKLGLINEVGSQTNAINQLKKLAIIDGEIEWVIPPKDQGLWSFFTGSRDINEFSNTMQTSLNQYSILDILYFIAKSPPYFSRDAPGLCQ